MAVTIGSTLPAMDNFTTGGSDVVTEIVVPRGAAKLSLYCRSNAGKLCFGAAAVAESLADAGALGAADYLTLPANSWVELRIHGLKNRGSDVSSYFVTSATGSTVVEVVVEGGVE